MYNNTDGAPPKAGIRSDDTTLCLLSGMSRHSRVGAVDAAQSGHSRGVHVVGRSWLHRIYCMLCVGSQLTSHTSSTATPAYLSLSSLVMVWRWAETPRDGSRHHVWLDSLVGPCAVRGAICRWGRATPRLWVRVREREIAMMTTLGAHRAFRAITRPVWALLHDGGG